MWGALNPMTGAWEWQTATPGGHAAMGPVTVADGVVYAGTTAPNGNNMFALNAATGKVLWRYPSGASVESGPSVVDGTVYWGEGAPELAQLGYTSGTKLYAFTIGGQPPGEAAARSCRRRGAVSHVRRRERHTEACAAR
jgi:polyvinyl alcohol dehydrogenase (cytochrome)